MPAPNLHLLSKIFLILLIISTDLAIVCQAQERKDLYYIYKEIGYPGSYLIEFKAQMGDKLSKGTVSADDLVFAEGKSNSISVSFHALSFDVSRHKSRIQMQIFAETPEGIRQIKPGGAAYLRHPNYRGFKKGEQIQEFVFQVEKNSLDGEIIFNLALLDRNNNPITFMKNNDKETDRMTIPFKISEKGNAPIIAEVSRASEDELSREENFWNSVLEKDTEDEYVYYIRQVKAGIFPGTYSDEAYTVIKDEREWKATVKENTDLAYRIYMGRYPRNGRHYEEAVEALNSLRTAPPLVPKSQNTALDPEDSLMQIVRESGEIEGYETYLQHYPSGKYVNEALPYVPILVKNSRKPGEPLVNNLTFSYLNYPLKLDYLELAGTPSAYAREQLDKIVKKITLAEGDTLYSYYLKDEGINIDITPNDTSKTLAQVKVKFENEAVYNLTFIDNLNKITDVSLDATLFPISLESVEGLTASEDEVNLEINGGKPKYYIRIFNKGETYQLGKFELSKRDIGENIWYFEKSKLLENGEMKGGEYNFSITDERNLEEEYREETIFFPEVEKSWISYLKPWMVLLPLWLALMLWFIRYNRKRNAT